VKVPFALIGGSMAVLLLSGCATDHKDEATQAQYRALMQSASTAEAMVGAVALPATAPSDIAASEELVSEQNLEAMAAHMVSDIPNAARLNRDAGDGTARILVDQQYFTLENGLAINKILFAHRLLAALTQTHSRELSFVEPRQGAGSGRSGGGGKGGGSANGGSKGGNSKKSGSEGSPAYRLEGTFSALAPNKTTQSEAQRYAFRLVDTRSGSPIWMGHFDIDRPAPTPPATSSK